MEASGVELEETPGSFPSASSSSSSSFTSAPPVLFSFFRHLLLMDRNDPSPSEPSSTPPSSAPLSPRPPPPPLPPPTTSHFPSSEQQQGSPDAACTTEEEQDMASNGGGRTDISDDDAAATAPWPQQKQQQQLRSEALTQKSLKSEEYRQLFHLPPEEMLIEDFNCALQKKILLQGHMYLFDRYVCFYSNIFGYEKKKIIPLKDVTCVRKARTAGVFPNAIEIIAWGKKVSMRASLGELGRDPLKEGDKAPGTAPKGHFFASFLSRDEAFRLIIDGWIQHSSYAKFFLNTEGSLASLAASPQSRTFAGENGGTSNNVWQSPLLVTQIEAGGNYESRVDAIAASLVEPAEGTSNEVPQLLHEQDEGICSMEDEGTTSNASSFSQQQAPIWEVEDADAPPLGESYKTVVESEFPVDVEEFYQLFFSDEGIGFAKDFHTKCGDDDFRCTQWAKHRHFGHARDISFRHPINFYFGPKSTYCHEAQRFRVYRNNHLVLETSQQMTDIPFGDYFRVEVRWDVERLFGKGGCHCFVRISLDVAFSKKTMWRSRIEQGTFDESKEAYTTWIQSAQGVLREMKAMAARHQSTVTTVVNEETGEGSARSQDGHQRLSAECEQAFRRGEVAEHTDSASGPPLRELDEVGSGRISAKDLQQALLHPQGPLEFQSQPEWARKASSILESVVVVSRRAWQKRSTFDLNAGGGKQLKLVLFMLIAAIIVIMQIGIIITLVWPPKVQLVPVGGYHHGVGGGDPGTCFGVTHRDETLVWLERRALHVKDEIAMAEMRLQNLHQDLALLKLQADQYQKYLLQISAEPRTAPG